MATSAQVRDEILAGKWDETLGALYGGGAAELRRQPHRPPARLWAGGGGDTGSDRGGVPQR